MRTRQEIGNDVEDYIATLGNDYVGLILQFSQIEIEILLDIRDTMVLRLPNTNYKTDSDNRVRLAVRAILQTANSDSLFQELLAAMVCISREELGTITREEIFAIVEERKDF